MAITVTPRSGSSVSVSSNQSTASLTIKKTAGSSLQSLNNVVTTDLDDGYTLIYDADTDKWVAQPLTLSAVGVLDGGTY